jgi:hypothetical protein
LAVGLSIGDNPAFKFVAERDLLYAVETATNYKISIAELAKLSD